MVSQNAAPTCQKCATSLFEPEKPLRSSTISRDILDSNEPVSDLVLPSIREFILQGSVRRERLDKKIASLRSALEDMLKERDPLDAEIRKHEGAISPLRRMPAELLSLIFTFASSDNDLLSVQTGPWIVSAVCSRWRQIALSQPGLWTSIYLCLVDEPPESPSLVGIEATLAAHLERSQQLPLTITFRTFYDHECTAQEGALLDLLAEHSNRWETVTFSGPLELYSSLDNSIYDLPILRELDIMIHSIHDEAILGPVSVFDSCPKLQRAFVNAGPHGGSRPVTVDLPFPQLLFYSGSNPWINHVPTLRSAGNIVDCVLHLIEPSSIPPGSPIVALPHLLRLSISQNTLLDFLDIPALQELYTFDESNNLHPSLTRLPNLEKLFIAGTRTGVDVSRLLHAAPTITNLCVYVSIIFVGDLFSALAPQAQSEGTRIVSPLHTISLRVIRDASDFNFDYQLVPHLDQDLLMSTLESHWQCGGWRTINLYCPQFTANPTTLERLHKLRSQGMSFQVFRRAHALLDHVIPRGFEFDSDFYSCFEPSYTST